MEHFAYVLHMTSIGIDIRNSSLRVALPHEIPDCSGFSRYRGGQNKLIRRLTTAQLQWPRALSNGLGGWVVLRSPPIKRPTIVCRRLAAARSLKLPAQAPPEVSAWSAWASFLVTYIHITSIHKGADSWDSGIINQQMTLLSRFDISATKQHNKTHTRVWFGTSMFYGI